MAAVVGGRGLRPLELPRLWLWVEAGAFVSDDTGCVATCGFVAAKDTTDSDAVPEGHYARLRHDPRAGTVTLSRSHSGGERLYFTRLGDVVFFATTVRAILAHPRIDARLNLGAVDETLMTGLVLFGPRTLHEGIDEVPPGHSLRVSDVIGRPNWHSPDAVRSVTGSHDRLAREFRDRLTEAVVLAAGPERPVAVALSGGIDSSAIAVAAVEAFGADAVTAYTYEFADPDHSTEIGYARVVAAHLGIRRHETFELDEAAYLAAIPEMVWRSESLVHWPKAFMLLVARAIRDRGHSRYLTGFGIGSHMGYMRELAAAVHGFRPRHLLRRWRAARFDDRPGLGFAARLHPGLAPPHPRLYFMLARLLHHAGVCPAVADAFPAEMHPMLTRLDDLDALEPGIGDRPLFERLQRQAFSHLLSCIDVTRSEKASRELGVYRISPAHFATCLPYAYFPPLPTPRLWSAARDLRPGKHLLRLAYRDHLPDSVLYRVKSWGDAVASGRWLRRGRIAMLDALPDFPSDFDRFGPGYGDAMRYWEPRSILATGLAFRFWERLFVDSPHRDRPPTWASLADES